MKLGSVDISKFNAKQFRVTFEQSELDNDTEWLRGAALPIWDNNFRKSKQIKTELLVYGSGREAIRNNISNIVAACALEPVEITLDGYSRKFKAQLKDASVDEGSDAARRRYQHLTLTFEGYEHGDEVTTSGAGVSSLTVNNPGNVISPLILQITPTIGISSLAISGITRDSQSGAALTVTVDKLTTGNTVILNGVTGLVTESGSLKEIDMWALPTLEPGSNTITFNSNRLNVTATVLPIYI